MSRIIAVKIKNADGTYSEEIPVSALAENIGWDEEHSLKDVIGNVNPSTEQSLKAQITALNNNIQQVSSKKASKADLSNFNTSIQSSLRKKLNISQFTDYQQQVNGVFTTKVSNATFNSYKDEVDARFNNLVGSTQITELQNQIDQKADSQDLEAVEAKVNKCALATDLTSHIESAKQTATSINQEIANIKNTIGSFNDGDKISQKISQIESNAATLAKKSELTDAVSSLQSSIGTKANASDLDSKVNETTFESRVLDLIKNNKSHVGQVIMSTTLNTQTKVKNEYGGEAWEQIKGAFLLGAGRRMSGEPSFYANDTGGEWSHSHMYGVGIPSYYGALIASDYSDKTGVSVQNYDQNNSFSWATHHTAQKPSGTGDLSVTANVNKGLQNAMGSTNCSVNYSQGKTSYEQAYPPYYVCYIWRRTQ